MPGCILDGLQLESLSRLARQIMPKNVRFGAHHQVVSTHLEAGFRLDITRVEKRLYDHHFFFVGVAQEELVALGACAVDLVGVELEDEVPTPEINLHEEKRVVLVLRDDVEGGYRHRSAVDVVFRHEYLTELLLLLDSAVSPQLIQSGEAELGLLATQQVIELLLSVFPVVVVESDGQKQALVDRGSMVWFQVARRRQALLVLQKHGYACIFFKFKVFEADPAALLLSLVSGLVAADEVHFTRFFNLVLTRKNRLKNSVPISVDSIEILGVEGMGLPQFKIHRDDDLSALQKHCFVALPAYVVQLLVVKVLLVEFESFGIGIVGHLLRVGDFLRDFEVIHVYEDYRVVPRFCPGPGQNDAFSDGVNWDAVEINFRLVLGPEEDHSRLSAQVEPLDDSYTLNLGNAFSQHLLSFGTLEKEVPASPSREVPLDLLVRRLGSVHKLLLVACVPAQLSSGQQLLFPS